jgi:hypothetical protein
MIERRFIMNAIFDLKDGQVLDIKNNRGYSPGGCPTCEHGSVAVE